MSVTTEARLRVVLHQYYTIQIVRKITTRCRYGEADDDKR